MMNLRNYFVLLCLGLSVCITSCNSGPTPPSENTKQTSNHQPEQLPTIRLYTLGKVPVKLRQAMLDSLSIHYPRSTYAGNSPLPSDALTARCHDYSRYRADLLNKYLTGYKKGNVMVVGLTTADIGLDNFRNRPHSGIMGMASGIGTGVAVFSSYRPRGNGQLFSLMLHELGHAQGLRHCPDERCMMQNAKGGNPFSRTHTFCSKCRAFMTDRGWKL